jgi:lysophospholipase L1-like esterase
MKSLPRVVLLGDSIRGTYQAPVAERLAGRAEVVGPSVNGEFSARTLEKLDQWLAELGTPDVVHWNNGLHDVGHNLQRSPIQFPLPVYVANLEAILRRLRSTGAAIIWATTTPLHPNRVYPDPNWSWRQSEIDAYNQAALKLMHREAICVNDLASLVLDDLDSYLVSDGIHLTDRGIQQCADAVAASVTSLLPRFLA